MKNLDEVLRIEKYCVRRKEKEIFILFRGLVTNGNKNGCIKGAEGGQKESKDCSRTSREYQLKVDGGGREESDATPQP